jgi:hypothetical protein
MQTTTFVRKPFTVEATQITEENIEELAPLIGTLRRRDDGTPYIQVNRRFVPNVFRVYPGFWVTLIGENVRCYTSKIFSEQFTENTPEIANWVAYLNGTQEDEEVAEEVPQTNPEPVVQVFVQENT